MKRSEPSEGGTRPSKRSRAGAKPSQAPDAKAEADGVEALEPQLLEQMVDFLDGHGGSFDFGHFAAEFPGVKKRQLEPHFDFVPVDGPGSGRWEIRLSETAEQDSGNGVVRTEGKVLFYDRAKGYGFLHCKEHSGDVFFPRNALPREMQDAPPDDMRGIVVSCDFFTKDGKPRADRISPLGGNPRRDGPSQRRTERSEGGGSPDLCVGKIVRYEEAKGYGFIEPDGRDEDIFFLRSEMPHEMATLVRKEDIVDTRVEFEVEVRPDGKLRAKHMTLLEPPPNRGGGRARERSRSRDRESTRVFGRIVRYDRSKGYGFIHCPDEPEDVFFLPSALPRDLQEACRSGEGVVDMDVEVDVKFNDDGKPRATRIVPAAPPRHGHEGGRHERTRHLGQIIVFDANKGFGFLKSEDFDEDVFFLRAELPPELAGAQTRDEVIDRQVEFEVFTMPDGKPRGQQLELVSRSRHGGKGGGHRDGPRMLMGRIRKFDRAKGYGFLELPGEPDVFFLPSALPKELADAREPLDGLEVTFECRVNEEGKPRATRMQLYDPRLGYGPMMPPGFPLPPMVGPPPMGMPMMGPMGPMRMPMMGPMGPMGPMLPPGPPPMALARDGHAGDDARAHVGSIVAFDPVKGFGFIASDGFAEDLFFLRSELPSELRETQSKDEVIGQRVEFEVRAMDGKLRAKRILLLSAKRRKRARREDRAGSGGRTRGKILRYDKSKGYGFIAASVGDNVFFLRSCLPKDMQELDIDKLRDLEVTFELYENEDGKPRAKRLEVFGKDRSGPSAKSEQDEEPSPGAVHSGVILRFEPGKGYGFAKADDIDEDIFFNRSEMPPEISSRHRREEVENLPVEFEVRTMPDGKLRAFRLELLGEPPPALEPDEEAASEPAMPPLDEALLADMAEFLAQNGGACDYGRFASMFPKVKKKQLEGHFEITTFDRGVQRIELPEDHPLHQADPAVASEEADNDVPPDEPAIPLGPGCQPFGFIRGYDAAKGYGFIRCEGMDEDVFFPRAALPESFHSRRKSELPELVGVQVAFELNPESDRGPRAERITLLLQWHTADRCWLLRRN